MTATAGGLACTACGDPTPPVGAARVVRCAACRALMFVEDAPTPHVMVQPVIDSAGALAAARSWMHGLRHREGLARRAELDAPSLVHLPFTRVEASVLGWVYGQRKHTKENRTWYTDEEIHISRTNETIAPLSAVGELGVEKLPEMAGVPLVPFDDAAAGEIVPALESETTAAERAHESFLLGAHKGLDLHTITGDDLTIISARETVIHYPFWRIDYRVRNIGYHVVIDARTGEVAYGRAPGSLWFHSVFYGLTLPAGCALICAAVVAGYYLLFAGVGAAEESLKIAAALWVVAAVVGVGGALVGLGITLAAHRALTLGGEVESGYGVHDGASLTDAEDGDYGKAREKEREEIEADAALLALESQP